MLAARERMLHIKRMHVQLERSKSTQLPFYIVGGRNWSSAYVVRHSTPAHSRPIDNLNTGNKRVSTITSNKLFESLQPIEHSRRRGSGHNGVTGCDDQDIPLFIQLGRHAYFRPFQSCQNRVTPRPTHRNCQAGSLPQVLNKILHRKSIVVGPRISKYHPSITSQLKTIGRNSQLSRLWNHANIYWSQCLLSRNASVINTQEK